MDPPFQSLGSGSAASSIRYLHIPNLLVDSGWPWERKINPHYQEVAAEGDAWFTASSPLTPKSQRAFETIKASLLAALVFPDVSRDQLRTCVDFLNVFFLVEEYTDVDNAQGVCEIVEMCTDALRNPNKPRPGGELVLGELIRQYVQDAFELVMLSQRPLELSRFWDRGRKTVPDQTGEHFVKCTVGFLNAILAQAEARDNGRLLTPNEYFSIRLDDTGIQSLYALGASFMSIPDHIHEDSTLSRMALLGCEIIAIDNDVLSYNRERANGNADFNIVTITMHHNSLTLEDTIHSLAEKSVNLQAEYMQCFREVCSNLERCGSVDEISQMRKYLDHMGNMRVGIWSWSFECGRYFGERGSTYAKTQMIPLVPQMARGGSVGEKQLDILLMEEELGKLSD